MAKRSVVRQTREINPMFNIPDGMDDWTHPDELLLDEEDSLEDADDTDEDAEFESDIDIIDDGDDDTHDAPEVPENLVVLSQTIRRNADGSMVVDLLVEVDDVPGFVKYDIRVVKV